MVFLSAFFALPDIGFQLKPKHLAIKSRKSSCGCRSLIHDWY